jgi:hypothetical protein
VQDHRNYEIKTPFATLGVRATIIEINLEGVEHPDQSQPAECRNYQKIKLVEGGFEVRTISNRTALITEPGTVVTVCADGSFQTTKLAESILNFTPQSYALRDPGQGRLRDPGQGRLRDPGQDRVRDPGQDRVRDRLPHLRSKISSRLA